MTQTIIRRSPFADLAELRSRFDHLFSELIDGEHGTWRPAIDVVEAPDQLVVHVNVPGMKPEDVKVEVQDDRLTISGEHEDQHDHEDEHYVHRERRYGSFTRTIALPDGAKRAEIDATCHDGVLDITIPLAETPHETRTITPKAA